MRAFFGGLTGLRAMVASALLFAVMAALNLGYELLQARTVVKQDGESSARIDRLLSQADDELLAIELKELSGLEIDFDIKGLGPGPDRRGETEGFTDHDPDRSLRIHGLRQLCFVIMK